MTPDTAPASAKGPGPDSVELGVWPGPGRASEVVGETGPALPGGHVEAGEAIPVHPRDDPSIQEAVRDSVPGFLRGGGARTSLADCRRASRLLVGQGKWTLPGMAVTWGQTTGYAYIVAAFLGSAAVAEMSAARLFVMPLNTLMTASPTACSIGGSCVRRPNTRPITRTAE